MNLKKINKIHSEYNLETAREAVKYLKYLQEQNSNIIKPCLATIIEQLE